MWVTVWEDGKGQVTEKMLFVIHGIVTEKMSGGGPYRPLIFDQLFKACNDFVFDQEYICIFSAWRRYDMLNIQSSYVAQGISLLMVCLHVG